MILAWDNQKGTFLTHFFNFGHEGAPNVTKLTYNMKILWENSHRKKNWGSFVHRGLRYDFLRRKNMDGSIDLAVQHFRFTEDAENVIARLEDEKTPPREDQDKQVMATLS